MTCEHCVAAVTRALKECHGVASVQVDLPTGRAVVAGEQLNVEELISSVQPLGYHARGLIGWVYTVSRGGRHSSAYQQRPE